MTKQSDSRPAIGLFRLSLIAIFVGLVTGFGAIAFRGFIGFIHNLLFLGRFSVFYDANSYTLPSPWGIFVIFVPVIGACVVTLLGTKFAPEARGHWVSGGYGCRLLRRGADSSCRRSREITRVRDCHWKWCGGR